MFESSTSKGRQTVTHPWKGRGLVDCESPGIMLSRKGSPSSPLSLRERGLGVRAKILAAGRRVLAGRRSRSSVRPPLQYPHPALSRGERVVYASDRSTKVFCGDSSVPKPSAPPRHPPPRPLRSASRDATPFGDFGTYTFPTAPARYARALALAARARAKPEGVAGRAGGSRGQRSVGSARVFSPPQRPGEVQLMSKAG
jgi:hypothetical protein